MLVFAILIITIAHVIRILRWEFLIETYEKPNGDRLTKALSLGYFINYFIPFKIGDFFRAMYAGKGMENGRGFALATVIVERCLDILSVGILFGVFSIYGMGASETALYYILLAAILLALLVTIYVFRKYLKRLIFTISELFNEKFQEKLLRFSWALIWGFKDILNRLPKLKLILYTVAMWGLYLVSYGVFSAFLDGAGINRSFSDVFFSLFDQKSLLSSGLVNGFNFSEETVWYGLFMLAPTLILFVMTILMRGFFNKNRLARDSREQVKGREQVKVREKLNLIPQTNLDERLTFLKMYFAGEKKEYIENYLKINRNILVLRDYSAGSNATTILCTDGENSFYRKYAFMDAAQKLAEQISWIEEHDSSLPVAEIIRKDISEGACFYDMPYYHDAVTLFEYSQTGEYDNAWNIIERVLESLEGSLYLADNRSLSSSESKISRGEANCSMIDQFEMGKPGADKLQLLMKYIDTKVLKNIDIIMDSRELSEILSYDKVIINGREYKNFPAYLGLFNREYLLKVFENDEISDIHGDLTVENIVYEKGRDSFYLIDPNSGNIFNSKFIDYAKLLQSLHGKYEYLMAVKEVSVTGNRIDFKTIESGAYENIYEKYREYLNAHFTREEVRSIYYHEAVNWLRLMPYKLKKGRGALFFAGMIMVLDGLGDLS